jgi:methionine synthase / methylenetetrahydrofolate reductase(NADPH)
MGSRFEERLQRGPIVGDGGMGALITSAVQRLRCPEEANIRAPDAVVSLHVSFINAGADLIETNTFGANRPKLAAHYLEDEFERINSQGVRIAREAREVAGRADVFIGGAIGPLGELEDVTGTARREHFAEQARLLEGRGADVFLVETFFDLHELVTAIEAVKGVSSLPIVAMLSFDEDAQTAAGVSAQEAADVLSGYELAAIGANHGAGPLAGLAALEAMGSGRSLAVMPNIGLASLAGGRVIYPHAAPEYFAEFAAHARDLGARVIGGCCGTTPAEIAAIHGALEEGREARAPFVFSKPDLAPPPVAEQAETELARALREGEWVTSVQIDPPLGGRNGGMLDVARELAASGVVGFLDINDNPMARARMSALMAAVAIEGAVAIETIPHQTPRDTTLMGLESILLGAHAAGVRNVLAVTGDPPAVGDYPGSHGVYEVDSIGLVQMIARLNRGEDYNGKAIDAPTAFYPGVAVNPSADDLDLELERFARKVEAGASFAMTQIVFDLSYLERFLERLGGASPIPLLVGLWPLRSHQLALRLHNEVPGIVVPEPVQRALEQAGPRAPEVGLALARELLAGARELAAGIYVVSSFRQPLAVLDLLR